MRRRPHTKKTKYVEPVIVKPELKGHVKHLLTLDLFELDYCEIKKAINRDVEDQTYPDVASATNALFGNMEHYIKCLHERSPTQYEVNALMADCIRDNRCARADYIYNFDGTMRKPSLSSSVVLSDDEFKDDSSTTDDDTDYTPKTSVSDCIEFIKLILRLCTQNAPNALAKLINKYPNYVERALGISSVFEYCAIDMIEQSYVQVFIILDTYFGTASSIMVSRTDSHAEFNENRVYNSDNWIKAYYKYLLDR